VRGYLIVRLRPTSYRADILGGGFRPPTRKESPLRKTNKPCGIFEVGLGSALLARSRVLPGLLCAGNRKSGAHSPVSVSAGTTFGVTNWPANSFFGP
jgi:hypothetical protein